MVFHLGFTSTSLSLLPTFLPAFIKKKCQLKRIISPFSLNIPPVDIFMVNPLGLIKKRYTNPIKYWVITYHLAPLGSNINDGIDKHKFRIFFDTFKYAVKWIRFVVYLQKLI